jgi:hypothetical protein
MSNVATRGISSNDNFYCHDLEVCEYRRGIDWILDLLTQLETTHNYSAIDNHHNTL